MPNAITAYEHLTEALGGTPGVTAGQMFGKPCLKVNGKAFVAQHLENVVFKLPRPHHDRALAVKGAALWDPSGKGRPMKEWVAVPLAGRAQYAALAQAALDYVAAGA